MRNTQKHTYRQPTYTWNVQANTNRPQTNTRRPHRVQTPTHNEPDILPRSVLAKEETPLPGTIWHTPWGIDKTNQQGTTYTSRKPWLPWQSLIQPSTTAEPNTAPGTHPPPSTHHTSLRWWTLPTTCNWESNQHRTSWNHTTSHWYVHELEPYHDQGKCICHKWPDSTWLSNTHGIICHYRNRQGHPQHLHGNSG